jgi:hypothetical protein
MIARWFVLLALLVPSGCGSRCKTVAQAKAALTSRAGASGRGVDVEVTVSFARANAVIAELLQQQPVTAPLDVPDLGPLEISTQLTAIVRELVLQPGQPGKVRFTVRIEIDDRTEEVTTLRATAELAPVVSHDVLVLGLGPDNVLSLVPELSPSDTAKLGGAVTRWIPARIKSKLTEGLIDAAAARLGKHLTEDTWAVLQKTLLVRLGELTSARLRLPDVPIAHVDVTSATDALVVAIATDLPVRAGLARGMPTTPPPSMIGVRISGSAAAELANWALDRGYLPRWYTRSLEPSRSGEFRPRFDYLAGSAHPLHVYAFQERGGCSFFEVGVASRVAIDGDRLVATATDRELERQSANPAVEMAAWVKLFVTGWIDQSKRVAAHTQLTIGGRALDTRIVSATHAHGELMFGLEVSSAPGLTSGSAPRSSR